MHKNKTLTIFTPTYNRAKLLKRAYHSLLYQSNKDFEWLIIDDGSSDNTEELVKSWIKENKIIIKYYKKENGGKHTAINFASNVVQTELIMLCLDSDDYLTEDAVEKILNKYNNCNDDSVVGIVSLCTDENKSDKYIINYNKDVLKNNISVQQALKNNYFNASAIYTVKSKYFKKFRFPENKNEKFFTEAYLLYQYDEPFIWTEDRICIREYQNEGLTKNIKKLFAKYPNSWFLYNQLRFKLNHSLKNRVKFCIYYIAFGILANKKNIIKNSPNRVLTFILYPLGFLGSLYLKRGD